ncbi:E3 ubiquitin [Babesia ovata]|uniref:E3 ubiquitin n=1 Tax=Babesia ovata TaxID=189622 RepID=A0A2H6KGS7_9APIC|nr:E3 ubiquitin [Babesia ovata]GBE62202.1 E3 ubiquitin [Babesia ovata]
MDKYVLAHFDWSAYTNAAQGRFLEGREGVFWSNGFHNLVTVSVICGLAWWACRLWSNFYSLRCIQAKMQSMHKVLHLNGMAEYYDDLLMLTKEHFNTIVKSREYVVPLPVARIRMPSTLIARSLRLHVGEGYDYELSASATPALESAAVSMCLDSLEVSFSMDCNRTTFVSAHWGVPSADVHNICVDTQNMMREVTVAPLSLRRFLRRVLFPSREQHYQSLLDTEQAVEMDAPAGTDGRFGRFTALDYTDKICSNEAVCFDAGSGIRCTVSPPIKTVEVDGSAKSIWDVLLSRKHAGRDIIPLVVVLYSPRTQDAKVFSEGSVETYLGIAEITLVTFSGSVEPTMPVLRGPNNPSGVVIDGVKQVCFSNDFGRPQEPRDMFGMGDDVDKDCLICLCTRMDTVLMPCGHASFCYNCLQSLRTEKCPVCRAPFKSYVRFPLVGTDSMS